MAITLTRKQAQLLDYIGTYTSENGGVSPSFDEMKDALGLKSKSGVHRLVDALVERGRIVRLSNRARSLAIVPDDPFAGIPTHLLIAELARRGETNAEARRVA